MFRTYVRNFNCGDNEPTPEMSVAAPEFGAIAQSTRAAGIGASPESSVPFDSSVCCGRSGSNGPNVGFVKFCHTRENGPNGSRFPQSSTVSTNAVVLCGHADCAPCDSNPAPAPAGENSSWMSQ